MKNNSYSSALQFSAFQFKRVIFFAFTFSGLKLNAISAALLFSNFFTTLAEFGRFEYALSIGLILSAILNFGIQAAIPYFLINKKRKDFEVVFYFHGLVIISAYLLLRLSVLSFNSTNVETAILCFSIALIFSLQIIASVISKSKEKIYDAAILEGLFFLLLNSYNLYLFFSQTPAEIEKIQFLINMQIGFALIFYSYKFRKSITDFKFSKYVSTLKFGKPILSSTFLIMILTGAGRIFSEYFFDLDTVALYGIYFRLAALTVIIYQILNIAFYKKIYSSNFSDLDTWFASFLILIATTSIFAYFLVPNLAMRVLEIIKVSWQQSSAIYATLMFQMFFWIAHSLFENIIARENLTDKYNKKLIGWLAIMILILVILHDLNVLSLPAMILINGITMFLVIESQLKLLKKIRGSFPNTSLVIRTMAIVQFILLINQFT